MRYPSFNKIELLQNIHLLIIRIPLIFWNCYIIFINAKKYTLVTEWACFIKNLHMSAHENLSCILNINKYLIPGWKLIWRKPETIYDEG